jgi:putative two-component system response regulator
MAQVEHYQTSNILIVDDEPANVLLLQSIFEAAGYTRIKTTTDPRQVSALVAMFEPDLILLDLHMPYLDGFAVMEALNHTADPKAYLPILVLTADCTEEARERALSLGAMDFLTKPFNAKEVMLRSRNLLHTRHLHLELTEHNSHLEERIRERTRELEDAQIEILERLGYVTEYRDDETCKHTKRVGELSSDIALVLGMSKEFASILRLASQLHDLGKTGVADSVLLKPGTLTDGEFTLMKAHTVIGADILSNPRSKLLQLAREIALTHHEWWDGSGYPNGLKGETIPISGRIVAVADVFDALTHERPYKPEWSVNAAVEEIASLSATHFDPKVVQAFKTALISRGMWQLLKQAA